LADPITFGCELVAAVQGATLEVRGYVPSQAVRERALRLANLSTSMPVRDFLQVHAQASAGPASLPAKDMQQAINDLLVRHFGEAAKAMQATARSNGHVVVMGTADSAEKRLAVSRSLRNIQGCKAVENLLTVPAGAGQVIARTETVVPSSEAPSNPPAYSFAPTPKPASVWKPAKPVSHKDVTSSPVANSMPSSPPAPAKPTRPTSPVEASEEDGVRRSFFLSRPKKKLDAPAKPAEATSTPPAAPATGKHPESLAQRLKHGIETAAGDRARDVEVVIGSGNGLRISFACSDKAQAEKLANEILALKELAPFEVDLDAHFNP
jgi:hypothetical protein